MAAASFWLQGVYSSWALTIVSVCWVSSLKKMKGCCSIWSGHTPQLQVWSLAKACAICNQSVSLSLSPFPLSKNKFFKAFIPSAKPLTFHLQKVPRQVVFLSNICKTDINLIGLMGRLYAVMYDICQENVGYKVGTQLVFASPGIYKHWKLDWFQ